MKKIEIVFDCGETLLRTHNESVHSLGNQGTKQQLFSLFRFHPHKQLERGLCVPSRQSCLSGMEGRRAWAAARPTVMDHQRAMGFLSCSDCGSKGPVQRRIKISRE